MVVLGVDVTKEELLEIAARAIVEANGTPASNVIEITKFDANSFARFVQAIRKTGCEGSWGQRGQLLVRRNSDAN
jgi:hypothetical protein